VLTGISPIWFVEKLLEDLEETLSRVLTFVPFTAPTVSLIRLGADGMGALDLALSLGALTISVAFAMFLTVRLFRAYLLLFGQRPSTGHILRTLRGA
jgi:ABC-2 type transport system permease protein